VIGRFSFELRNRRRSHYYFIKFAIAFYVCVEFLEIYHPFVLNCIWKTNFDWKV